MAILTRIGVVTITYNDDDKRSSDYRMSKSVAEMEHGAGYPSSSKYYESFGIAPPKKTLDAREIGKILLIIIISNLAILLLIDCFMIYMRIG